MEKPIELEVYTRSKSDISINNANENKYRYNKLEAAALGDVALIENLLKESKQDVDHEADGETAASLAFARGHHEVVLKLLKSNAKIPHNYQQNLASDELKIFVDLSLKLHESVRVGNLREILAENSALKYFYNLQNSSLMKTILESKKFLILKVLWENNLKLAPHEDIWEILKNFSDDEREKFCKIQLINFENFSDLSAHEITDYKDLRGFNALMIAAEENNLKFVEHCIKKGFFILDAKVNNYSAANLAFQKRNFEILLKLLEANAQYPDNFSINEINYEELLDFSKMSLDIHHHINNGDVDKVKQVLKQNQNLDYFYDHSNRSAFRHAVEEKKFEVYKLLVENFINFGPQENFDAIRSTLSEEDQLQMTSIQFELSESLISPTVLTLMAHSFVGHESKNKRRSLAMEAFQLLLKNPRAERVLKIVATQKNYQIVFDFTRDNIQGLDATAELYMSGTFYTNGRIYVAAEKLYDDEGRFEVLATLIHELCHFAMFVTFENSAKPYRSNDEICKEEFNKIIEECRELTESEDIIKAAFSMYGPEMLPAELIVRPVHIDLFYYGLSQVEAKQETFKSLYFFYDNNCMVEMDRVLPDLEAKARFTEKDAKIKKLKKFNIFLAILIGLALIFSGLIAYLLYNPTISWSDLTPQEKFSFNDAEVDFHNLTVKFNEIFANDSNVYSLLPSELIKSTLKGNTFDLSRAIQEEYNSYIFLTWNNMSHKLKDKFLTFDADFQGQIISFGNFMNSSKILNNNSPLTLLTALQIRKIFNGHQLKISTATEDKVKVYIERYFTPNYTRIFSEHQNYFHQKEEKFYYDGLVNVNHSNVRDFGKVFNEVNDKKVFLISSSAGDGKSTTLRHFAREYKKIFPSRWVQFVELKHYTNAYKNFDGKNFSDFDVVTDFLGKSMLELNEFEFLIFSERFRSNNVIFFWDGVDEIAPIHLNFSLDLTSKIRSMTKNLQFISTRPQYSHDFQQRFEVNAYKLMIFGELDRFEYLVKLIALQCVKFDENLIFKELKGFYDFDHNNITVLASDRRYIDKISNKIQINSTDLKKIIEKIAHAQIISQAMEDYNSFVIEDQQNLEGISTVLNPLLVAVISELAVDDDNLWRDQTKSKLSKYKIYETFVMKKIVLVMDKGKVVQKDFANIVTMTTTNVMQIHQMYALKSVFIDIDITDLSIMKLKYKLSNERISRFGILQVNSDTKFDFIHQTFAEFLVAQFLLDNMDDIDAKSKDGQVKILLFNEVMQHRMLYYNENAFIDDFIESRKNLSEFSQFFTFWHDQVTKIKKFSYDPDNLVRMRLLDVFISYYFENNFNATVKLYVASDMCVEEYAERHFFNSQEKFISIFGEEMFRYAMIYRSFHDGDGILKCDFKNERRFVQYLNFIQNSVNFTQKELERLLLETKYSGGVTLLMEASRNVRSRDLEKYLKFIANNVDVETRKEILKTEDENFLTALQYSSLNLRQNSTSLILNFYRILSKEELQKIILKFKKSKLSFLDSVIYESGIDVTREFADFLNEIFSENKLNLRNFLAHRDAKGNSIFSKTKSEFMYNHKYKKHLEIFIELLRKTFDENESEMFEIFLEEICVKKV